MIGYAERFVRLVELNDDLGIFEGSASAVLVQIQFDQSLGLGVGHIEYRLGGIKAQAPDHTESQLGVQICQLAHRPPLSILGKIGLQNLSVRVRDEETIIVSPSQGHEASASDSASDSDSGRGKRR